MCRRACCLRCSLRGGKCIWDCLEVYSLTLIFALPSLWINRTDGQKLLMLNSYGGSKNFRKSLQVAASHSKSLQVAARLVLRAQNLIPNDVCLTVSLRSGLQVAAALLQKYQQQSYWGRGNKEAVILCKLFLANHEARLHAWSYWMVGPYWAGPSYEHRTVSETMLQWNGNVFSLVLEVI